MKSRFTNEQILNARKHFEGLTPLDLLYYWKHYTVGSGKNAHGGAIRADTTLADYLVISASQNAYERANDI